MNFRTLGRTGLKVSEVGFGAWAIGGNRFGNSYGPTDDDESEAAIAKALALGCTFFDTADVYGHGHSEELLGEVIGGDPNIFIATKVGGSYMYNDPQIGHINFSPQFIRFACQESLKRLRRDCIDLYQLHNPNIDLIRDGRVFAALDQLKSEGLIRFYGVSIFTPEEGIACIQNGSPDTLQVVYNIFFQAPAQELFPLAKRNNIGIIAREPLANGFLTGKYRDNASFAPGDIRARWPQQHLLAYVRAAQALAFLQKDGRSLAQAAIRFVLDQDAVSTVIPGAKKETHVEENLAASDLAPLSEDAHQQIRKVLFGG